ncbi:piggyBac transposable element-derived protein 4-like [Eriocheir sinensis]|uniref:piggyBac transposable element-derived protein 4-like n=1 Tax=Eriocheir sinensis TaxID=95602 RepID=UPI0021C65315|nr:piggyBac transposable element-derived protein 4-like [Eriocheir sinensis]
MGIVKLPSIRDYWTNSRLHNYPVFPRAMSGKRFLAILKYLHAFNCCAVPLGNTDSLIKVRPVMEYLLRLFKSLYTPTQNLSLDEGSLGWKGRLHFRVYNPMKPTKYAIKVYLVAEVYVYGTLRLMRGAPKRLQDMAKPRRLADYALESMHRNGVHVLIWKDKKAVPMVSTMHTNATNEKTHHVLHTIQKPVMVEDYNQFMGGVDHFNQMEKYYPVPRRSTKWTKKLTFYFIQMALFNAHTLYKKSAHRHMSLKAFMSEVIEKLLDYKDEEWPLSGVPIRHAPDLPAHLQAPMDPRTRVGRVPAPGAEYEFPPFALPPFESFTDVLRQRGAAGGQSPVPVPSLLKENYINVMLMDIIVYITTPSL